MLTGTLGRWLQAVGLCICVLPIAGFAQLNDATRASPELLLPDLQRDSSSRAAALEALFTWTLWGYARQAGDVIVNAGLLQPLSGEERLQSQFIIAERAAELLSVANGELEFDIYVARSMDNTSEKDVRENAARGIQRPPKPTSNERDKAGQVALDAYRTLGRLSQIAPGKERLGWQIRALTGEANVQRMLEKNAAALALLSRADALHGAEDDLERVRIQRSRAEIFESQNDMTGMVRALDVAENIVRQRAPPSHPYRATILPVLAQANIAQGRTQVAREKIAEYLELQAIAPGGATFRGQREAETADLFYEAGAAPDAERLLRRAIETVLSATDEIPIERVKQVETIVQSALVSHDKVSVLRASQRAVEAPFVKQYRDLPSYIALVDLLGSKSRQEGVGRLTALAEGLRRPGGILDIDADPASKALLNSVRTLPVQQAAALALEQARASDTAVAPIATAFMLQTALDRVNAEVGKGSPLSSDVVDSLTNSLTSAQLSAKSAYKLLEQSDAIVGVESRDLQKSSAWHRNAASKLLRMGDPRHADDMSSVALREETLDAENRCRKLAIDDFNRRTACRNAAEGRSQLGEFNVAVGLLMDELASYRSADAGTQQSLASMYAGQTEKVLYEVLGRSPLATRRDDFFEIETDGTPSKANVPAICTAWQVARPADPLPMRCMVKPAAAARGTPASDIDAERQRLLEAAAGDPQALPSQGPGGDPVEYAQRLRHWAEGNKLPLDRPRLALLLAWEVRSRATPRNEVTEAEIVMDLAELYTADAPGLAASLLALGLPAAVSAGAQAPVIPERLTKLASTLSRHAPEQIAALTTLLVNRLNDTRVPLDENFAVRLAELDLNASRFTTGSERIAALERVQTRLAGIRTFLLDERTDLRLETFARRAVQEAREAPASAARIDKILQKIEAAQVRLSSDPASATIAAARVDIADLAGTKTELPRLMQAIERGLVAREADGSLLPYKAEELIKVRGARVAIAEDRRKLEAALSTHASTWGSVVDHYVAVVLSTLRAQDFIEAHAQIVRATAAILRERAKSETDLWDPFAELEFRLSSNCRVEGGELIASSLLLPGRLHACGQAMGALARERLLLRALNEVLMRDGHRTGTQSVTTAKLLDDYLQWRAAIAPRIEPGATAFNQATLNDLDFARSARSYLAQDSAQTRGRSNFLLVTPARADLLRNAAQREVALLNLDGAAQDVPVKKLIGTLGKEEAIVVMHQSSNVLYRWVISSGGISAFHDRVDRAQLRKLVARLRETFLNMGESTLPDVRAADHYAAFDLLWRPLLKPLQGKTQVWIVPNGPLAVVPFPALVTQLPPEPIWRSATASWRPMWFVERWGSALVRSLQDFRIDRVPFKEAADQLPYIGMGDPVVGNPGSDEPDACIAGMPLPGAAKELARAGHAMGSDRLIVSQDFTARRLESASLERYRIILIATHAIHPGMTGCKVEEPALVLSRDADRPHLLYTSDLQRWRLRAQVVIVAACESGADDLQREDRPIGALANALVDVGARSVIAATWPVLSIHSADVTTPVMEALAKDLQQSPSKALHSTMVSLVASSNAATRHPAVWAAYFSIGGL